MTTLLAVSGLSDTDLLAELKRAAADERHATAALIALLAEVDERRLYLGEGCSSLFTYCTQVLHLSEHAAYGRIEAARASRRWPILIDRLNAGSLTLTAVALLAPHLTSTNLHGVLERAKHKSKREIEQLVACLHPRPDVQSTIRKVAQIAPSPAAAEHGDACFPAPVIPPVPRHATIAPLAPERFKLQVTIGRETYDKLQRVQDLLRHAVPHGDLSVVFDRALTVLLADLERAKLAASDRPRASRQPTSGSRHIPAAVRRAVWKRDGGRCAFIGTEGRCSERGLLEFHHVSPYADGGGCGVDNIALRCRAHNMHEAEKYFGNRLPLLARERPVAYNNELGPDRVESRQLMRLAATLRPSCQRRTVPCVKSPMCAILSVFHPRNRKAFYACPSRGSADSGHPYHSRTGAAEFLRPMTPKAFPFSMEPKARITS